METWDLPWSPRNEQAYSSLRMRRHDRRGDICLAPVRDLGALASLGGLQERDCKGDRY